MSVWIAVHGPVNVGGTVIQNRREHESVIPAELVPRMGPAERAQCIKISDDQAKEHFPQLNMGNAFYAGDEVEVLPPAKPAASAGAK